MKVGIISDSHDHLENLAKVLTAMREHNIEAILHAGDLCSPFVLPELDQEGIPVHIVFGNNDGDQFALSEMCHSETKHCIIHGELAELEFDGFLVAMTHYPKVGEALAHSGEYDLVVYGHTHITDNQKIGECILINPGEVMGRKGKVTYVIFDTNTKGTEIFEV